MNYKTEIALSPPAKGPNQPCPVVAAGAAAPSRPRNAFNQADPALRRPEELPSASATFLSRLIQLGLLDSSAAGGFLEHNARCLGEYSGPSILANALVRAGLLTEYQADRALAGTTHGLVFGNYRVLDRLGAGAMGTVFLAEHRLMGRRVAVKVLPVDTDCPPEVLDRFYSEMRILADLHHANIVLAIDAGRLAAADRTLPELLYLVMELMPGGDLEQYVIENGPVDIAVGCEWVRQAACGLQEAHDHHLIHRDVKPSNLLLTARQQLKVVDFGLARQFCSRLTNPRALLGTLDYMPPEQSIDPSNVDARSDIYGLGATLFWLLTGQCPYPQAKGLNEALLLLQREEPHRLGKWRPDAPLELEAIVARMLDRDPSKRPASPINVMNALLPFAARRSGKQAGIIEEAKTENQALSSSGPAPLSRLGSFSHALAVNKKVLIVDDEESLRRLVRHILEDIGCVCAEAADAAQALSLLHSNSYDLVILDLNLPDMDGYEVCRILREDPRQSNIKVMVVSGRGDHCQLAESLPLGADDYVPKPFAPRQLQARAVHALELKAAQDRADFIARQLALTNQQLENSLAARNLDVRRAQDAFLFGMAKMAEARGGETAGHLRRLQAYTRCLAEHAFDEPTWAGVANSTFLEHLERCVPLHDIGKIGLPDHILLKTGPLTEGERSLMETHTIIGDRILEAIGREHGESLTFLGTASAIVRHHHERFDGSGYPDHLVGEAIPAVARLVAVSDVYDALRRRRHYRPALSHSETVRFLIEESSGRFDPALISALGQCEHEFKRIYEDIPI